MPKIRILFSEGSSLSARETLTALGLIGNYEIFICDPNPICLCRFTRFKVKFYQCPSINEGIDPYFNRIIELIKKEKIDVLIPNHEQSLLFSKRLNQLSGIVKIALPEFESYIQLFSKIRFFKLLGDLDIPYPETVFCNNIAEIREQIFFPCFLKSDYGTASKGVWKLDNCQELESLLETIPETQSEYLIQKCADGKMEVAYSLFERGNLISFHISQRIREGQNGSSCSKIGIERSVVEKHFRQIGKKLKWHGPLAIDYFYDDATNTAFYIDASPRLVEPLNSYFNGVNFPEQLINLSLGKSENIKIVETREIKTHMLMMSQMYVADKTKSRLEVLKDIFAAAMAKGDYQNSTEELTNLRLDWVSLIPLLFVIIQILILPRNANKIADKTVGNYALSYPTVCRILAE
jgi:predicted ATP-grasp superfamily ATP-dependent carboligase